jgi:hypothetical protein
MALFLLVTKAGLTSNQSKSAVLLAFWALRGASCVPDSGDTAPRPLANPYSKRLAIRLPFIYSS